MRKRLASCLMSTLFMTGIVLAPRINASSSEGEWSLKSGSNLRKHCDINYTRIFIFEQLRKIEKHIFEEINIQDYLIEALEESCKGSNSRRFVFDFIENKTRALNFLDLSRRFLFGKIIASVLQYHRFDKENYLVDQELIKFVMNIFAQGLTCDHCKRFAEKLRKDPIWLRNMMKLDLIKALELKLDGRYLEFLF